MQFKLPETQGKTLVEVSFKALIFLVRKLNSAVYELNEVENAYIL